MQLTTGCSLAAPAYGDPDDDDTGSSSSNPGDSTDAEICGAFNLGVPPADIPGMLQRNNGQWNYWRGVQRTRQDIIEGA
jgi:hypothetical protein